MSLTEIPLPHTVPVPPVAAPAQPRGNWKLKGEYAELLLKNHVLLK